jgi:hypothetical protein
MNDNRPEFSVYVYFRDGRCEAVCRFVDAETAVKAAKRLSQNVGAKLGTTQRILITSGDDTCCFHWQHGLGVTFPPYDAKLGRFVAADEASDA